VTAHEHQWGPITETRSSRIPHRQCTVDGCDAITDNPCLVCRECGALVDSDDSPGVYHHVDNHEPTGINHDLDEDHTPIPVLDGL
jgi:hypothetical protein